MPAITFGELGVASIVQEGLDHLNVPQFSSPVCIVVATLTGHDKWLRTGSMRASCPMQPPAMRPHYAPTSAGLFEGDDLSD